MNDITAIFLLSIISAFVGFGFQRMMDFDMIFFWYGEWLQKTSKKNLTLYYVTKPLGRCILCNTTWIGVMLTIVFFYDPPLFLLYMLIVGVASAGMVIIIVNLYHLIQNAL